VPDKPLWLGHLDEILLDLAALPQPWVDRATVERVLGVGRRRAQQILAPCVSSQIGANGLADRDRLIAADEANSAEVLHEHQVAACVVHH
jgi:hypothetical protein